MVTRKSRIAIPVTFALFMVLFAAIQVDAHPGSDWYPTRWPAADTTVNWRFTTGVPNTAIRDRMKNGATQWNNVSGSVMKFQFDTPEYAAFSGTSCASTEQKNAMHYGTIDGAGGVGAIAIICTFFDATGSGSNARLHDFQIKWDSAETWYTGTGTPSTSAVDAYSVATHELGHATGRGRTFGGIATPGGDGSGHFFSTDSTLCPSSSARHTMCQTLVPGTTWMRDLNTHDKDSFAEIY